MIQLVASSQLLYYPVSMTLGSLLWFPGVMSLLSVAAAWAPINPACYNLPRSSPIHINQVVSIVNIFMTKSCFATFCHIGYGVIFEQCHNTALRDHDYPLNV